jgi:hypothetical protein
VTLGCSPFDFVGRAKPGNATANDKNSLHRVTSPPHPHPPPRGGKDGRG